MELPAAALAHLNLYVPHPGYPTTARDEVDPREVVEIGTIAKADGRLEIKVRLDELSWWIDPADLADLGVTERPV